jgi:hypothetical protein
MPLPVARRSARSELSEGYDKPVLLAAVADVLLVAAAGLGLLAWSRRWLALLGIAALAGIGVVAAALRGGFADALPSAVAALIGAPALGWAVPDSPRCHRCARSDVTAVSWSASERPAGRR